MNRERQKPPLAHQNCEIGLIPVPPLHQTVCATFNATLEIEALQQCSQLRMTCFLRPVL